MNTLDQSLGHLARTIAGATQIFHEYGLDFCCGGKQSLREAARAKGLQPEIVARRLENLQAQQTSDADRWKDAPTAELIAHIVDRFHERHRVQLPELIRLARKVEQVHGDRAECPHGLADHLGTLWQELESHMHKEERVLFPLLSLGARAAVQGPILVMRMEHDNHGEALQRLIELTDGFTPPATACNTWRALYLGLATLCVDLMEHIHLENNVLFETASQTQKMESSHG
ncbi:iron-sulfur cluster repair protein YtfE [Methylocaldum sp. MU1018]